MIEERIQPRSFLNPRKISDIWTNFKDSARVVHIDTLMTLESVKTKRYENITQHLVKRQTARD